MSTLQMILTFEISFIGILLLLIACCIVGAYTSDWQRRKHYVSMTMEQLEEAKKDPSSIYYLSKPTQDSK
jgi:hypothetical protein